MSKAALDAFTLALAQDLGRRGIIANTIAPGAVETDINSQFLQKPEVRKQITDQTALGRIGDAGDIANVVAFLASDDNTWSLDNTSLPQAAFGFEERFALRLL